MWQPFLCGIAQGYVKKEGGRRGVSKKDDGFHGEGREGSSTTSTIHTSTPFSIEKGDHGVYLPIKTLLISYLISLHTCQCRTAHFEFCKLTCHMKSF